ncbi:AI-2E family transporter [Chlorogloeopsis fritschii PCC 9212]|uniref:AI-2E family transporter n=1 Tax=Chlorogloeopsis fritschii PCC 6912 TaxID=211165 RepID=A0A433MWG2_CHLFR|nr:AI-2E family transporter [Chlorogloeopsis fritschii]RUR72297.1 AI-2E family transporter [Chlorogloeopsis fritschii PCC 6912]
MKLGQWLGFLALVISLYILWQIRQLLLLSFTAVVLAVAINQLVLRFQQSGIKRVWAVWLSLGIVITLLVGVFFLIVPPFIEQFRQLVALLPTGINQIQRGINWLEERILENYVPEIPDFNGLIEQLQPLATNLLQQAIAIFSTSVTAILEFLLVIVLTLMLLANPQPYRRVFIRFFPAFYRPRVEEILSRCAEGLGNWTIGALIEMVFIGVLSGVGLWILGVPLVLAHAVLAGLLNFIPNIGPTLSVVLPMAIGFLDAPWKAGAVLILYIVIQNIESYWLTPTVMAKQVALLPAVTLTAQIVFVTLFGALGLLMAIPLAVVAKTWIEEVLFKDILDQWRQVPSSVEGRW